MEKTEIDSQSKICIQQFKDSCNKIAELINQHLFDGCRKWYWIGADVGGVCNFENTDFLNTEDMVRILDNDMDYDDYVEWRNANIDNNQYINLKSWLMGARHTMFKHSNETI